MKHGRPWEKEFYCCKRILLVGFSPQKFLKKFFRRQIFSHAGCREVVSGSVGGLQSAASFPHCSLHRTTQITRGFSMTISSVAWQPTLAPYIPNWCCKSPLCYKAPLVQALPLPHFHTSPHYHASPLSNSCPPWRKEPGATLTTATSSSAGTIPIGSQEPPRSALERHLPVPTLCADGSGSPVIFVIYLSLARPGDNRDRRRAPDRRRGIRRHLGGETQRSQGCVEIISLLRVV